MKATKIIIASLLVIAAVAYAAKVPVKFCEGLEGFCKPDTATPVVTTEGEYTIVDFGTQLGEKGQVQFTTVNGEKIIVKAQTGKAIAQKGGKVVGKLDTVDAGDNVALKLKGISLGTVAAKSLKSAQVAEIYGGLAAGNFAKGSAVKVIGKIDGTASGSLKSLQAGSFGTVDGLGITTPKKFTVKSKSGGTIYLSNDMNGKTKAKGVTVEYPVD